MGAMDPYRPPRADLEGAAVATPSSGKVYSIRQITAATFLGTPLAGAILMAGNLDTFGQAERRRRFLVLGGVATALLMLLALVLPDRFPNSILPLSYCLVMHSLAKSVQAAEVEARLRSGSTHHSNWRVVGIGLASMAAILATAFVLGLAYVLVFEDVESAG